MPNPSRAATSPTTAPSEKKSRKKETVSTSPTKARAARATQKMISQSKSRASWRKFTPPSQARTQTVLIPPAYNMAAISIRKSEEIMDQARVVLDCDTANEVDDQFAIAHALGLPEGTLDVRGVISVHNTTAHGPTSRAMYQEEAERVVTLCGSDVPCIPGAERPMESGEEPVPSAGLEYLVEEARLGPLTIIATGPATDAASLFLAAPESRENVRVVWLGGVGDEGSYRNWQNRMGELNGRADIAAYRTSLEEPVDLLHIPTWPAPAKILVDPASFG